MKNARRWIVTGLLVLTAVVTISCAQDKKEGPAVTSWRQCLNQSAEFYASDEAVRIADNVILYQRNTGGWQKGIDMARILSEQDKAKLRKDKSKKDSTLDNGATHTQMQYLARVYNATKLERFKDVFLKGLDYLLEAQYENGGWPQFYPWQGHSGYSRYITFNDNAMIGALTILRDIAEKKPLYAFVDEQYHEKAVLAVQKSIECILKCQIVTDGKKTAWCAQHDEKTFEPRKARSYELPSISGSESVGVVRFLMSIDNPNPRVIEAVRAAVAWFDQAKLSGIRQTYKRDKSKPRGYDKVIIEDPTAPPIWARFYQIGTNKPIFCSRDGVPKATLAEISYERRTGYSWLGYYATDLLARDYPAWEKKLAPENVQSR